jgi:hypothetical protein
MAQFNKCPLCGSHLDHGEICDCKKPAPRPEPPRCRVCGLTAAEIPHYQEQAETGDPNEFVKNLRHYDPETNTFECVPCRLAVHGLVDEEHIETEAATEPRPIPVCAGCGMSFLDCDAYVSEAERQGKDPWEFLLDDPCYNPTAFLFLCPDCWDAAGRPAEMVQPDKAHETGLIVRPVRIPEVVDAPADDAGEGEEAVPQAKDITYTCKYCGQTSFTPGCNCDGAEAAQRREAAERGREEAYHDMAELLFPRFTERDDEGYKSDPNYKMFVAVIDRVIDGGIAKATMDLDCENKVAITVKDYQVQMQLTRTIKTAKTASVA